MLDFLQNNASTINAMSGVAMLAVWTIYLRIFQRGYQRQTRAKIIINRAAGQTLGAQCFIANMSSQSIYVEAVIVTLDCRDYRISMGITDLDPVGQDRPSDPRLETHQGPLHSGEQTWVGTFDDLIKRVAGSRAKAQHDLTESGQAIAIEVMVIADYLADDLLVGARRRFVAEWNGETWFVRPETAQTDQIRSWRERRAIRRLVADDAVEGN